MTTNDWIEQQLTLVFQLADAVEAKSTGRVGALLRKWDGAGERVALAQWYTDLLFKPDPNFPTELCRRHGLTAETEELAAAVKDVLEDAGHIFAWSGGVTNAATPDPDLIRRHVSDVRKLAGMSAASEPAKTQDEPLGKVKARREAIKKRYLEQANDPTHYPTQDSIIAVLMKELDVARSTIMDHLKVIRVADPNFPGARGRSIKAATNQMQTINPTRFRRK